MKRRVLALLMSALLCLSLLPAIAFAAAGDSVVAFTSDTHNTSSNAAATVLDGWIDKVQLDKSVIDYMGFCGDLGDSSANEANYWTYTQAVISIVSGESIDDGYVPGNHEHINGNFSSTTNTVKNNFSLNAEAKNGDNYRVYALGSNSSSQDIPAAQVTALTNYLNGLDNSEPIFIQNHYPLHYYSSRTTTNAASVIDALNAAAAAGKKIVFVWGHNHTLDDPSYDQIFVPGSSINPTSGTSKTIQFYYASAGCMYGYGANGIDGRGLVVTVSSSDTLSFAYYKEDGTTIGVYTEPGSGESHTVTFNSNGGTGTMSPQTASTATALTLNAFTRTGYTFAGWNTAANGSGTPYTNGQTYSFAADITLYAQWTESGGVTNATVNITSSSTVGAATASATISVGGTLTINLKNGSSNNSKTYATTINDGTVAQITSGASLNLGTSATGTVTVLGLQAGTAVITSTGTGSGSTYTATINLTVTGSGESHTVTFNPNGGSGTMGPQTASAPTALTANAFTRADYTFTGWNTAANGSGTAYSNGQTYSFSADVTLYAQWAAAGGTTYQLVNSIEEGGTYLIVARAGSTGSYTYYAMTTDVESDIYLADKSVTVAGDFVTSPVDGTMLWTFTTAPTTAGTYDVKNGTNFLLRISYNDGGGIKTAAADSGAGYSDWAYDGSSHEFTVYSTAGSMDFYLYRSTSGTAYFDCSTTASGTIYLYKQITSAPTNHTVTFNSNGGTGTMSPQTAGAPAALTANAFTRTDYTFTGWNTAANGSGTSYTDGQTYSFSADVTLYAQWAAVGGTTYTRVATPEAGKQYVIVAQDGSYYGLTTVANSGYTNSSNYSYSGFNGTTVTVVGDKITSAVSADMIWKLEAGSGGRFLIKNVQNSNYLDASYNTSAPMGGSLKLATSSQSWGYSSSMLDYSPISGTTTKYLTYDTPDDVNGSISSGSANLFTLRSQANSDNVYFFEVEINEPSSHTVTFNSNGGTGTMSPQTAGASTALTLNSFTRTGYVFAGWNTVAAGGGDAYTDGQAYSFSNDVTLYAQWIPYGDVNGDGVVSDIDRTTLARYLAGWPGYTINASAADVNADGKVSDVDRTILARHLAVWSGYGTLPYLP